MLYYRLRAIVDIKDGVATLSDSETKEVIASVKCNDIHKFLFLIRETLPSFSYQELDNKPFVIRFDEVECESISHDELLVSELDVKPANELIRGISPIVGER